MSNLERLVILEGYFGAIGIDSDMISPNLVASVVQDHFPWWNLTGNDIVFLSNNL